MPPRVRLAPPLLNSATPWATTREDLQALYDSPYTGAVTTRTSLLDGGFPQNPHVHQHHLFGNASLNTYGYSPEPLAYYLECIEAIVNGGVDGEGGSGNGERRQVKPFIVSVTGSAEEVAEAVKRIDATAREKNLELWAEINLSCPNIPNRPPPAFNFRDLCSYVALLPCRTSSTTIAIPVGLKTPPYTSPHQTAILVRALRRYPATISFITATNTLGNALHLSSPPNLSEDGRRTWIPTLSSADGTGRGGLAGEGIHWLSLGNVDAIRRALDTAAEAAEEEEEGKEGEGEEGSVTELRDIVIIGVGGVADRDGWSRMLAVGAGAVGVGTALGREGVDVFRKILEGDRSSEDGKREE